jgi:EAL domain-containing protein (putative c-di-GMP-specific phosphodiesterase class I)
LKVIAEGIEEQEQAIALLTHNCHHGQGYLFGRPAPLQDFEDILKHTTTSADPA